MNQILRCAQNDEVGARAFFSRPVNPQGYVFTLPNRLPPYLNQVPQPARIASPSARTKNGALLSERPVACS